MKTSSSTRVPHDFNCGLVVTYCESVPFPVFISISHQINKENDSEFIIFSVFLAFTFSLATYYEHLALPSQHSKIV